MISPKTLACVSWIVDEAQGYCDAGVSSFEYNRISTESEIEAIKAACSGFADVSVVRKRAQTVPARPAGPEVNVYTLKITLK